MRRFAHTVFDRGGLGRAFGEFALSPGFGVRIFVSPVLVCEADRAPLQKGCIGGVEIRNRVAMTAMGNGLASWDGEASPELIRFYEDRARGGCGLIFTEFTRVDETSGACNPNQLCIVTRKHIRSVQRMAEQVHRHGARSFA